MVSIEYVDFGKLSADEIDQLMDLAEFVGERKNSIFVICSTKEPDVEIAKITPNNYIGLKELDELPKNPDRRYYLKKTGRKVNVYKRWKDSLIEVMKCQV